MDLAKDRNGKTEQEFLRDYDVTKYFRPSVTVDAVLYSVMSPDTVKLLMIRRGGHPFIGTYAFPGGFVEKDEPCEDAVLRELKEETDISGVNLHQLVTVSTPDRDPRWRNITVVYCGEVSGDISFAAGDDADDAKWFTVKRLGNTLFFTSERKSFTCALDIKRDSFGHIDINKTKILDRGLVAFDHAKIICYLMDELARR